LFTVAAVAAESQGAAEDAVLWTTPLSDQALAAHAALVHNVRDQSSAAAKLGAQSPVVDGKRSRMPEPKRALSMRRRAVPLASVLEWLAAQRAQRSSVENECRAITRSVTQGTFDRGGHASAPSVVIGERCEGGVDVPLRACASLACL